ncbi:MAG: hypothetical protein MH186_08250 [Marinobacter sp.]|nr:hypothetical protein [Marinobacter sp.]
MASGEGAQRPFGAFKGELQPKLLATLEEVDDARQNQGQLVDARPADYFTGKEQSSAAKAAGTIPGAMNLPHQKLSQPAGQSLVPELRHHCRPAAKHQSGSRQARYCLLQHRPLGRHRLVCAE